MTKINPPSFPAIATNMATAQNSLSVVTFESPFPLEITTMQFHSDYLVFLKANHESLHDLTTFHI